MTKAQKFKTVDLVYAALGWCVLPFVLPDLLKLVLALIVSRRVSGRI